MEKTSNSSSWGDMVRTIDAERKTLPWQQGDFLKSQTMSLAERKLKERDVDLIAMAYRDSAAEDKHTAMRSTKDLSLITRRKDILKKKFDFVSHEGPPRRIDSDHLFASARKDKGRGRDWHLLSHLNHNDHNDHTKVPIRYEEDDRLETLKKFPPPSKKGRDPGRDFNIVSGKFKADDESKQQKIAADIRESCDKKFWKTHSYDYVKIKYHDPKLQEQYIQKRDALAKTHGVAQASRLPHSLAHSEGKTYDILNYKILDAEKLKNGPMHDDIRAFNRMKRSQMDDDLHRTGDFNAMVSEEKSLKKISFKRWEGSHDRGYNMLNNTYLGDKINDTPLHMPAPTRSPTQWKQLEPSPDYKPISTTISNNNFLGTHVGTGMSLHRAHTSYPSSRVEGGFGLGNGFHESTTNLNMMRESEGKRNGSIRAITASPNVRDYNGMRKSSDYQSDRHREIMANTEVGRPMTLMMSDDRLASSQSARNISTADNSMSHMLPYSQRNRPGTMPLLHIGQSESPIRSVRTGGLSIM